MNFPAWKWLFPFATATTIVAHEMAITLNGLSTIPLCIPLFVHIWVCRVNDINNKHMLTHSKGNHKMWFHCNYSLTLSFIKGKGTFLLKFPSIDFFSHPKNLFSLLTTLIHDSCAMFALFFLSFFRYIAKSFRYSLFSHKEWKLCEKRGGKEGQDSKN